MMCFNEWEGSPLKHRKKLNHKYYVWKNVDEIVLLAGIA